MSCCVVGVSPLPSVLRKTAGCKLVGVQQVTREADPNTDALCSSSKVEAQMLGSRTVCSEGEVKVRRGLIVFR